MKLEMVGLTDVGVSRQKNEDSFGIFQNLKLGMICDGMGGHQAGAFASHLAVEMIKMVFHEPAKFHIDKITEDLDLAHRALVAPTLAGIRLANRKIVNLAAKNTELRGMGTTASVISFENGCAVLGHVGDSRIYRIRDRELIQLTEDHSWVNELIQDKEIKKEDARYFEQKNVITRALGMAPTVKVDLRIEPVAENDIYLLCSDGLTNSLNDDLLQAMTVNYQNNLKVAAENLINMAKQVDGSDNITVVLLKVIDAGNWRQERKPMKKTVQDETEKIAALENRVLKPDKTFYQSWKKSWTWLQNPKIISVVLLILVSLVIFWIRHIK
jgi:protein phosphatase